MIRAIKNWFFKRWVLKHVIDGETLNRARLSRDPGQDLFFYSTKKRIRMCAELAGFSPDLIELAEGALTVVKGDRTARIEV